MLTQIVCILRFFDAHVGAITAIATAIIALFTIVLAWVACKQTELIRETTTHRPKIIIRAVKLAIESAENHMYAVKFVYVNSGNIVAHVTEIGTALINSTDCWNYGSREVRFDIKSCSEKMRSGEEKSSLTRTTFDWDHKSETWFCVGYIQYADARDVIRKTGFCRKWNPENMNWDKASNEEYEYSY